MKKRKFISFEFAAQSAAQAILPVWSSGRIYTITKQTNYTINGKAESFCKSANQRNVASKRVGYFGFVASPLTHDRWLKHKKKMKV